MTLHYHQREAGLNKRRGHRPRLTAPGAGRRPLLTLADRLLATVLHHRLGLPQTAVAALVSVRPETINRHIREIRQLLEQAGHAIQPGPHRLASLDGTFTVWRPQRRNHRRFRDQDGVLMICKLFSLVRSWPRLSQAGLHNRLGRAWSSCFSRVPLSPTG